MTPAGPLSRYAVVAGGAGAVGAAVTNRLLDAGWGVVVLDRRAGSALEVESVLIDLTDANAVARVAADLRQARGRGPDALVLCQGWSPKDADGRATPPGQETAENFRDVIDVNLVSVFTVMSAVVPEMARRGHGRVVALGSTAGRTGHTTAGDAYAAAKAGVASLVRTFAVRYGADGVLVVGVVPGKIRNPAWPDDPLAVERYRAEIPVGRLAEIEEVARLVTFLVSEDNTYLTGHDIVLDGGRSA